MEWSRLNGYILDVDGTLYSQRTMRLKMLGRLLRFFCIRPYRLRELFALYLFRKLREKQEWKAASFEALYREIGERLFLPAERVETCIRRWMFESPLDILSASAYRDVISFVNAQHRAKKRIIIYSDYPAVEKLRALGLEYDAVFAFGENGIGEQKPSLNTMRRILSESGCTPEKLLYVGDRDDRDRPSAEMAHIPYCDIKQFRKAIREKSAAV